MVVKQRRIGVDTGGTFTDVAFKDRNGWRVIKVPSTPDDPAKGLELGLLELGASACGALVVHGTTVGINALLTQKIAPTALVTNEGFRDLIEIGRQERPDIYALHPTKPEPVAPRRLRFEVAQRSWPDPQTGQIVEVERPTKKQIVELVKRVKRSGAKSVAVCLLHSWATPEIELRIARELESAGLAVTTSAGLSPNLREYERFSTATINAALMPVVGSYIARLMPAIRRATGKDDLALLQSSGGTISAERAASQPARVLLSGPAGGVRGAAMAALEAGLGDIVTLDMGGTSTDVAFASGENNAGKSAARLAIDPPSVAGFPVTLPSLDIHVIGCGGGSLAHVDSSGALHVGPKSAGADPGPVAYGRTQASDSPATLTDAFVQLGHIQPGLFLAGKLDLDTAAVSQAFGLLANELGLRGRDKRDRAASAMIAIACAAMGRAVSAMTLQRGRDPRRLSLVAFGGAGGLMAARLAAMLGIPRVLIPRDPGVLSARGLASASFEAEASRTLLHDLAGTHSTGLDQQLNELANELEVRAKEENLSWRMLAKKVDLELRYRGQTFALSLTHNRSHSFKKLRERFDTAHAQLFGHALPRRPVELVRITLRAFQRTRTSTFKPAKRRKPRAQAELARVRVRTRGSLCEAPLLSRDALPPGTQFHGPAVIAEYSSTTWVPPGILAHVTGAGHLQLDLPTGTHLTPPNAF